MRSAAEPSELHAQELESEGAQDSEGAANAASFRQRRERLSQRFAASC